MITPEERRRFVDFFADLLADLDGTKVTADEVNEMIDEAIEDWRVYFNANAELFNGIRRR